jgi:glycosyltransferase involved in cell wall biosynthesis
MRMKSAQVIHVIGAMVAGGAERFVVSLVKRLKADGIDVGLWVLSKRCDAAGEVMIAELQSMGVPFDIGPSAKVDCRTLLWYAKLLSRKRPVVIHLHTPNTELVHLLSRALVKRTSALRSIKLFRTLHNTEQSESWLVRRAYRCNRAEGSIACGKAVAERYSGHFDGPLTCIKNGVDFPRPINTRETGISARNKLGLDPFGYHFINIGRMSGASLSESQKAHDTLIRAWHQSGLGVRNCHLHLLGDGNLRDQLVELADGDRSIQFHGVRADVHTWLEAADCFVMPSRYEGLPIAAIEAIGAGLPCIFTDIAPLRELMPPASLTCAVDDVALLAVNLNVAAGQQIRPSPLDVQRFRDRNSLTRTAQQYLDIYQANGCSI